MKSITTVKKCNIYTSNYSLKMNDNDVQQNSTQKVIPFRIKNLVTQANIRVTRLLKKKRETGFEFYPFDKILMEREFPAHPIFTYSRGYSKNIYFFYSAKCKGIPIFLHSSHTSCFSILFPIVYFRILLRKTINLIFPALKSTNKFPPNILVNIHISFLILEFFQIVSFLYQPFIFNNKALLDYYIGINSYLK